MLPLKIKHFWNVENKPGFPYLSFIRKEYGEVNEIPVNYFAGYAKFYYPSSSEEDEKIFILTTQESNDSKSTRIYHLDQTLETIIFLQIKMHLI